MSDLGNKEIFAKNLKHYMTVNDKSRNEICDTLGFKYSTFTDWCNGKKYPRIDKIEMLANYFRIEKSDLIERKSLSKSDKYMEETIKRYGENSINHLENYCKLNELGKQAADIYVEDLTTIEKYTEKKQDNTANG